MLRSLLIKLAMLAVVVGLVLWIGWPMPPDQGSQSPPSPDTEKATAAQVIVGPPQETKTAGNPQRLDLNRATAEDLQLLPGIGSVLAQRIVEWRKAHGGFKKVDELNAVKGIGMKKLQQIRPLVVAGTPGAVQQPHPKQARLR